MLRCTRCSAKLQVDFAFCANCGQKSSTRSTSTAPLVVAKDSQPGISKTLDNRQKRGIKPNRKNSTASATLNLPRDVLAALDSILAKPTVDDQMLTKRMVQQFQTQVLEMRNAEGVEVATMHKHISSLALEAPSLTKSSKYEEALPPSHKYLGHVESVSSHYRAYLARLKQLEGLRAAMMEPPQLPSEQQRESANASRNGQRSRPALLAPAVTADHSNVTLAPPTPALAGDLTIDAEVPSSTRKKSATSN